jgi:hypothetical protein
MIVRMPGAGGRRTPKGRSCARTPLPDDGSGCYTRSGRSFLQLRASSCDSVWAYLPGSNDKRVVFLLMLQAVVLLDRGRKYVVLISRFATAFLTTSKSCVQLSETCMSGMLATTPPQSGRHIVLSTSLHVLVDVDCCSLGSRRHAWLHAVGPCWASPLSTPIPSGATLIIPGQRWPCLRPWSWSSTRGRTLRAENSPALTGNNHSCFLRRSQAKPATGTSTRGRNKAKHAKHCGPQHTNFSTA